SLFAKKAAVALLSLPLLTTGCLAHRGSTTLGGAGLGAAGTALITSGIKDPVARGGAILGGMIIGGAVGSALEPACVNRTTSSFSRSVYGNNTSVWSGTQNYTEDCVGSGSQNISGAGLPPATQTNGFFLK